MLNSGRNEVVDADLSNYFGEIPHAELMKSIARRVSDGRMLGLIKAWLEMPVIEEDGKGGSRRTSRARKERKGTPQGAPISPLLSNIYMRRFILGWSARVGADRRVHIRQRGACAPKRHFHVRASAPLCAWLSCSCGTAAGAATPLRSFRPKKGATPPVDALVMAWGGAGFHKPCTAPGGSLPFQ